MTKELFISENGEKYFFCPFCDEYFFCSEYLENAITDEKTRYLANMICHYRHNHIIYYDNSVGYVTRFHDYHEFKELVNNRIKRQIIRKAKAFLKEHQITVEHFENLLSTDEKTIELAKKLL